MKAYEKLNHYYYTSDNIVIHFLSAFCCSCCSILQITNQIWDDVPDITIDSHINLGEAPVHTISNHPLTSQQLHNQQQIDNIV